MLAVKARGCGAGLRAVPGGLHRNARDRVRLGRQRPSSQPATCAGGGSARRTYVYQGKPPRAAPTTTVSKAALAPVTRAPDPNAPVPSPGRPGPVISDFGTASNGERNDGINIAMPMGTPIHAAASGTVSYSGDELKDYGNLMLIKHEGGYVTAYAHADQLLVVKRPGGHQGPGDRLCRLDRRRADAAAAFRDPPRHHAGRSQASSAGRRAADVG